MLQPSNCRHEALNAASAFLNQGDQTGAITILKIAATEAPGDALIQSAFAAQLFLAGRFAESATEYQSLARIMPDDADIHVRLALVLFKSDQIHEFELALARTFEIEPENHIALKLLGDLCLQQEQYKQAIQAYLQILKGAVDSVDVLHPLGVCFFKTGDRETARMIYERILDLSPEDALAQENLEQIHQPANAPAPTAQSEPAAEDPLGKALENADFFKQSGNLVAARAELELAANLAPENDRIWDALGGLHYQNGDYAAARLSFRRLIELRPRDSLAYTLLAMSALKCDRIVEFEPAIRLALEIDPANQTALELLAKTHFELAHYAEAGRLYSQMLADRPTDIGVLLCLGLCFVRGNETEMARETYMRVIEVDPQNIIARENLMALEQLSLSALNENQVTQSDIRRLLALAKQATNNHQLPQAKQLLAGILAAEPQLAEAVEILAKIHFQSDEFAQARNLFLKLTDLTPDSTGAWVNLALAALKLEDRPTFEAALTRAFEIDVNDRQALILLAQLNFQQQDWPVAARMYARVLEHSPKDVESTLALGVCFFKAGQHDSAAEMFRRVLELEPAHAFATDNLKAAESAMKTLRTQLTETIATHSMSHAPSTPPTDTNTPAARPSASLPPCAKLGMLDQAAAILKAGDPLGAWNACLAAIALRPFHPEAYLLMTRIALEANDGQQAFRCIKRLLQLTPKWDAPNMIQRTLKQQRKLAASKVVWTPLPEAPARPRLSVCLIVKNEERFLAQCLRSVKSVAHQIVLVDTGSTDRTVEIAKEHGAEVHHFAWNDNFSDARNFGLEHARGDWMLILDADEELMAESIEKLWEDLSAQNVMGYRIPIRNHSEPNGVAAYVPRLFRNTSGLCFIGRIHEQILPHVTALRNYWQMEVPTGTTTLIHYGYDPEVKKEKNKVKRNLALLERAVLETPNEPTLLMNFALDLVNDGQVERGLEQYRKAVGLAESLGDNSMLPEGRERLITMFIFHLFTAEHYEEATRVASSSLAQKCGPTASMHYIAAQAHIKLGQHPQAIPHLHNCIEKLKKPVLTSACENMDGAAPHQLLAQCFIFEGKIAETEKELILALELEPHLVETRHAYAKFLNVQQRPEEALPLLHQGAVDGRMAPILWELGCEITNGSMHLPDLALEWTESALADHPENDELRKQRSIALLTAGRAAEALPFFEATLNPTQPVVAGAIILCRLLAGTPGTTAQPSNELAVSHEFIAWYRRLLTHDSTEAVHEINRLLPVLQPILPTATKILHEAMTEAGHTE
ncbi:MAG: tetratricopeptide repeat protein [Pedosphaera sp.]|nr:tetratricopeptide repeat protein [Pedosphaera sp.]MST00907.1 tetratricopeptide repeat protein [Pedosphaera sp.]